MISLEYGSDHVPQLTHYTAICVVHAPNSVYFHGFKSILMLLE